MPLSARRKITRSFMESGILMWYGRDRGYPGDAGGEPVPVRTHDFMDKELGKAIPYGVYDVAANAGWVNVGTDHDTATFAVESIRRWWNRAGRGDYPRARRLLITADAGGSNGYRARAWKTELAALAAETGLEITVCHFPPGTRPGPPSGTRWSTGCSPTSR